MKKLLLTLGGILLIFILTFIVYSASYTISDDKVIIEDRIMRFINRPTWMYNNIDIKEEIDIDNKKYVLFILEGNLGFAELTKGINKKYKIEYTNRGSDFFKDRIIETSKGKYAILMGKNPDKKITYSKILLENEEYKITIPSQDYFIAYCTVTNETENTFLDINNIKLFDINDNDISDIYYKVER